MSNERVPIMHFLFILLRLKTLEITLANLQFFPFKYLLRLLLFLFITYSSIFMINNFSHVISPVRDPIGYEIVCFKNI